MVYQACVLRTLLYGSECWTLYSHRECRLNTFQLRCLKRILDISWQDNTPNKGVLARAGTTRMFSILTKRHLRWLDHVTHMQDGRLPKDILFGELVTGSKSTGRSKLRYKDVCKWDLKADGIALLGIEAVAADHNAWKLAGKSAVTRSEQERGKQWKEKKAHRREKAESAPAVAVTDSSCNTGNRICRSMIGLYSHSRSCSSTTD